MIRKVLALAALGVMSLMAVGCSCAPAKLNVTVSLDDAMRQKLEARKIEVDIVALNSKQSDRWETYPMTKFWEPNDDLRESVDSYKMIFDPAKADPQTLAKSDPHWAKWFANSGGGDMQLYVLALLPGLYDDAPGDKDPRRQILPLGSCRWNSTDVKLLVQKDGIITITPPKSDK
jgi:hypothetical protein